MPTKPKRIRKVEYDRIDRVDAGAQPGAYVTLVKRRTKIEKVIDPASIDAQVQRVRDEFNESYGNSGYGCCTPCTGYVWIDAVYDGFVVACDSSGNYWQFDYTTTDSEITFGDPVAVTPSVSWATDSTNDDAAPMPIAKALWSASVAERVRRVTKEQKMPDTPDLSALDDATRAAVEAAMAENAQLVADKAAFEAAVAAAPAPEPVIEDDDAEDLETIAGLQKALKATRSPETKRILKATLTRLEKAERETAELREQSVKLQKAERVRIFKERARAVPHIAPHAATDEEKDGITALAKMLEVIDDKAGSEVAEEVERMLTKAQTQAAEYLKPLLKSTGRAGGEGEGAARIIASNEDPEQALNEAAAELKKSNPDLSDAQARTRVLKSRPELYVEQIAR